MRVGKWSFIHYNHYGTNQILFLLKSEFLISIQGKRDTNSTSVLFDCFFYHTNFLLLTSVFVQCSLKFNE